VQSLAGMRLRTGDVADDAADPLTAQAATEAALIAQAAHDPQAFVQLYRQYLDPVYRYCYHRLGSKEAAEDVTSQVFVKVLGALPTYRRARPFRSWLFAIAHNAIADAHRAQRPHQPLSAAEDVLDPGASPEDLAVSVEGERTIQTLLADLTQDQARVVELRLVGLTEVEIARALGRRPGAIRALQFRALIRLRSRLEGGAETKDRDDA
jgi:RNA polymerase sigma-70 factor (ECF subfamily)